MTSRPIVVGYDGSIDAQRAARWALDEAVRTGSPVRLAYGFEWLAVRGWIGPAIGPGTVPDQQVRDQAEELVAGAVAGARRSHPGVDVAGEVLDGPPTVRLLERSAGASLMVLGSRGYGGFVGLLAGSTAVAVSAHADCPVVVVRGDTPAGPGDVLVGVDGSDQSLRALEFAADRAALRDVPLRVVRAWPPPDARWRRGAAEPEKLLRAERAELDGLTDRCLARCPGLTVTAEVVLVSPGTALVERSRTARLAVVGSRGRGGFRGLLLGSVGQQLLHHAHCPVAIVRELPAGGLTNR